MDRPTRLDQIRAWVEGQLPAEEARRLESELERDPELAELAERFRDVHGMTSIERVPPPVALTFERLEENLDVEPERAWPHWRAAAAAVLLLGAGAAAWQWSGSGAAVPPAPPLEVAEGTSLEGVPEEPGAEPVTDSAQGPSSQAALATEVRLVEIDFEPAESKSYGLEVPAQLASYEPRGEDGIAWFESWDEARFAAFASGRPVLVFGVTDPCVDCDLFAQEILAAPEVQRLMDLFVPMRWNLEGEKESAGRMFMQGRGDPLVEIWTGDDESVLSLARVNSPELCAELMLQGLERAADAERLPEWHEVRELAGRYDLVRAARAAGRLDELQALLLDLRRAGRGGPFAEVAARELRELALEAGSVLLQSRATADFDPEGTRARLEAAIGRFAGTSYEADLAAVRDAWSEDAPFPALVPAGS